MFIILESSVDEDWDRDFDIEVTEEDLKAAEEAVKKLSAISPEQYKTSEVSTKLGPLYQLAKSKSNMHG